VLSDRTTGIRASVEHVEIELVLAVLLVVLVIFAFLHSPRATLIASLAVPISLVGTCAAMYLLGYSLNNLSLMALTIATGFVVDDAIVMIENVARHIEDGLPPMEAALQGAAEIGFTIISLTVSLVAVLIPLLFMGDVIGRLFREFAVTLAITILISAVVSLTLVPMMSARWLKPHTEPEAGLGGRIQRGFDRVVHHYDRGLTWVLGRQTLTLLVALGTLAFTVLLYVAIPKGLFPTQDTGQLQVRVEAAQSISYPRMAQLQQDVARSMLQDPAVASIASFVGVDAANNTMLHTGRMLVNLKRGRGSQQALMDRLRDRGQKVPGVRLYLQPVQDLTIESETGPTQYRVALEGSDTATVNDWAQRVVDRLRQERPPGQRHHRRRRLGRGHVRGRGPGQRRAAGHQHGGHQRGAVQRLRPAHRVRPSSPRPISTAWCWRRGRRRMQRAELHPAARHFGRCHAADGGGAHQRAARAAAGGARRAVPGGHHRLRHGARRGAGHGRRRDPPRARRDEAAGDGQHHLPGRGGGVRDLAVQPAVADPGGGGVRLHRAGRAVRKLRAPADDPVHAALGRRRRAAGADGHRQRPGGDRHHRHHPADRHRQEERDHDDRLRARTPSASRASRRARRSTRPRCCASDRSS
jgi:hypothetical protein